MTTAGPRSFRILLVEDDVALVDVLSLAHGGSVEAASPPGQGAVITLRLPRRAEP